MKKSQFKLRDAKEIDIPSLVTLENTSFQSDQLSARSFRSIIRRGHSMTLIAEDENGKIAGYAMVLYHRGTSLARLYSLAIDPMFRGQGVGRQLMHEIEIKAARDFSSAAMRLEVRPDNTAAIKLYESLGYHKFAVAEDYYEDHSEAYRYEKKIISPEFLAFRPVPYYQQNLEFTCGPACLIMAFRAFQPEYPYDLSLELQLWREATTIFMTSGHGGCSPRGLALSAHRRGFGAEVWLSNKEVLFLKSVRQEKKQEILKIVHKVFEAEIKKAGIRIRHTVIKLEDILAALDRDQIPLVLISAYQITKTKVPHWIIVCAYDSQHVFIHDPDVDVDDRKDIIDSVFVPVKKTTFMKMLKYGSEKLQAMVVIKPSP